MLFKIDKIYKIFKVDNNGMLLHSAAKYVGHIKALHRFKIYINNKEISELEISTEKLNDYIYSNSHIKIK